MLPRPTLTGSSVHINPRFRNVHINPHFIGKPNTDAGTDVPVSVYTHPPNIHINPRFINSQNVQMPQAPLAITSADMLSSSRALSQLRDARTTAGTSNIVDHGGGSSGGNDASNYAKFANAEPLADTKIHSRTKIRNGPATTTKDSSVNATASSSKPAVVYAHASAKPLIRIGSKKLVRISEPKKQTTAAMRTISAAAKKLIRPVQTKYKIVKEQSAFRIDRRSQLAKQKALLARKTSKVNSIRRPKISESLVPQITVKRTVKRYSTVNKPTVHTEPRSSTTFLSINGILYKTNRRKLEKTQPSQSFRTVNGLPQKNYRRITVRGESFLLDTNARHLMRDTATVSLPAPAPASSSPPARIIRRIDIGKITFVRNLNGTYDRTDYHKSRFHLNVAKQRSIQVLTNRLVKSNVPCPIYRKLGKCAANERGKCAKLHDKKLVNICPRFLKGACDTTDCLLLHKTTLSKMPACKFYLNGLCTKDDCPYLHRKVNDATEICADFLKGYCEKAEECLKRHEFINQASLTKKTNGPHSMRTKPNSSKKVISAATSASTAPSAMSSGESGSTGLGTKQGDQCSGSRYFDNHKMDIKSSEESVTPNDIGHSPAEAEDAVTDGNPQTSRRQNKLGKLPSFIPIG